MDGKGLRTVLVFPARMKESGGGSGSFDAGREQQAADGQLRQQHFMQERAGRIGLSTNQAAKKEVLSDSRWYTITTGSVCLQ